MDTTILTAITSLGLGTVLSWILVKYLTNSLTKQIDGLTQAIEKLNKSIGNTYLDELQTINYFDAILTDHIVKKLDFVNGILTDNHIHTRRKEIEDRIRVEFYRITEIEKTKLSGFNSHAGDLARYFEYVDFEEFLNDTYKIVFSENTIDIKLKDLRSLMEGLVTVMIGQIKDTFKQFNNK